MLLREDGWDATHLREIGMKEATDLEIPDSAARESRVVITLDRDFPQILALTTATRPSVVLIRQQRLRGVEVTDQVRLARIRTGPRSRVGAQGECKRRQSSI